MGKRTDFMHKFRLVLLVLFTLFTLPFSGQAQTARENFSKAKYALEEANLNGCLIYLDRCEGQLGGSNVRIEALRAQCYAQLDDWVKAKIAFRNYYNLLDLAERGGETWKKMVELGREIDAGLEAQDKAFRQKKEDEKKENLREAETEIASNQTRKEEKKNTLNEKYGENLYQAAVDTRDPLALTLYKEQVANTGSTSSRTKKVDEELDKQQNPNKYLVGAVLDKNRKETAYLLSRGGNKDLKNRDDNSLLHIAVDTEDEAMLKLLKEEGADLEIKNSREETPLMYALYKDKFFMGVSLINLGADALAAKSTGVTALHYAVAYASDSRAATMLLAKGADANKPLAYADTLMTPLYHAVYYRKNLLLVQTLLAHGAKIDEGKKGWTPLMAAIVNHDLNLLQELLKNKPDLGAKGLHGWTALHFAARENQPEMVAALLKAGATKKAKDEWGRTPKKVASENELKPALKALRNP